MSDWRIRKRYGFGAARLRMNPEPRRGSTPHLGLWEALALARATRTGPGGGPDLRRLSTLVPALLLTLGVTLALFAILAQRPPPLDDLEIVRFEPPPVPAAQPEPEPIAVPDPIPPPARRTEPPPPPEAVKPPPPAPPPVKRVVRRSAPRVEPPPKPEVRIDAVPQAPPPAPSAARPPRIARRAQTRPVPAPAPVRIDPLESAPPVRQPPPVPTARRTPPRPQEAPAKAPVRIDPVASPDTFRPVASNRERAALRAAPARTVPAQSAPPRPDLSVPASPAPQVPPERSPSLPARSERELPSTSLERAQMPEGLAPTRFAAAAAPTKTPTAPGRSERVRPELESDPRTRPDEQLEGVALGALAACVSDREEDRLKLEVMAAVRDRKECASRAGRYRFVEKKNLNAFLMWVERAPSRPEADRCVELELALECLHGRGAAGIGR